MEANQPRTHAVGDWLWLLACACLSSLWCVTATARIGPTFDEPIYVSRGLDRWRTGSYSDLMRLGTMPLPVDVETLPLYLWERWRGTPFEATADLATLLPVARATALVFWWLLLFYAFRMGRALGGSWGGRLAVALLAVEPSFLGHAGLATTDIAVSACLLALVYHFRTGREAGWFRRVAVPTCWFALALLAKASTLVYGPLCLFAVEAERLYRVGAFPTAGTWRERWRQASAVFRPWSRDVAWVVGGGFVGMMLYIGSDWRVEPSFVEWAQSLDPGGVRSSVLWVAEHLAIFSNGGEGLIQQVKHNIRGHGAYLLGITDSRALWFYFPLLLTIKLTLPLLLMPLLVSAFRPRVLLNWATVAALFVVLVSPLFRVQLGIRLVLPIVALGVVGSAAALGRVWQEASPGWSRRAWGGVVCAGLAWAALDSGFSWPNGLCYINEAWGGTSRGYLYVSESNYDWGQGLQELTRWQRRHGLDTLDIWYFGSDPTVERPSLHQLALHDVTVTSLDDVRSLVHGRYLAVSATLLYGMDRGGEQSLRERAAACLRLCRPVARTTTFFIYDLKGEPAAPVPGQAGQTAAGPLDHTTRTD